MGLTTLPKRGEGQVLGPIKAESSLNLWDRLRRVFTSEWNGNAKGLEEVCEEVGLHDGSTEGSLVARATSTDGGVTWLDRDVQVGLAATLRAVAYDPVESVRGNDDDVDAKKR